MKSLKHIERLAGKLNNLKNASTTVLNRPGSATIVRCSLASMKLILAALIKSKRNFSPSANFGGWLPSILTKSKIGWEARSQNSTEKSCPKKSMAQSRL